MHVDIILPTYNSARFLDAQIASIVRQSHQEWCLFIRDDGSTDQTVQLIQDWQARDQRIHLLEATGHLGLSMGLRTLVAATKGQWIFLADHDDVWLDNKVECMLAAAREHGVLLENRHPVLVHSDLVVVDSNLQVLAPSLWRFLNIDRQPNTSTGLLRRNRVTGCATMINRCLADRLVATLNDALVHDWWMAQLTTLEGCIVSLDERLVLYRQHGGNTIGAVPAGMAKIPLLFTAANRSAYRRAQAHAIGHLAVVSRYGEKTAAWRVVLSWELMKRKVLLIGLSFLDFLLGE
jgi:glycosyltransferase involved in cell wall biosynthesis